MDENCIMCRARHSLQTIERSESERQCVARLKQGILNPTPEGYQGELYGVGFNLVLTTLSIARCAFSIVKCALSVA